MSETAEVPETWQSIEFETTDFPEAPDGYSRYVAPEGGLYRISKLYFADLGPGDPLGTPVTAAPYPGALPPDDQDAADARCPAGPGSRVPAQAVRPADETGDHDAQR